MTTAQQDQAIGAAHRRFAYARKNATRTQDRLTEIAKALRSMADELDDRTPSMRQDGYREPPKINWERSKLCGPDEIREAVKEYADALSELSKAKEAWQEVKLQ